MCRRRKKGRSDSSRWRLELDSSLNLKFYIIFQKEWNANGNSRMHRGKLIGRSVYGQPSCENSVKSFLLVFAKEKTIEKCSKKEQRKSWASFSRNPKYSQQSRTCLWRSVNITSTYLQQKKTSSICLISVRWTILIATLLLKCRCLKRNVYFKHIQASHQKMCNRSRNVTTGHVRIGSGKHFGKDKLRASTIILYYITQKGGLLMRSPFLLWTNCSNCSAESGLLK